MYVNAIKSMLKIGETIADDFRILYNGGYLPGGNSRNPHMQTMLRMVGFGENAGSGFPFILATWKEVGWVKPELIEDTTLNQVTLYLKMIPENGKQSAKNSRKIIRISRKIIRNARDYDCL